MSTSQNQIPTNELRFTAKTRKMEATNVIIICPVADLKKKFPDVCVQAMVDTMENARGCILVECDLKEITAHLLQVERDEDDMMREFTVDVLNTLEEMQYRAHSSSQSEESDSSFDEE